MFLSTIRVGVCDRSLERSQVEDGIYWHILKLNKGAMTMIYTVYPIRCFKVRVLNNSLAVLSSFLTCKTDPLGVMAPAGPGVRPLQCCIFPAFWGEPLWKCSFSWDRPSLSTTRVWGSGFWRRRWRLTDGPWKNWLGSLAFRGVQISLTLGWT